MYTIEDINKAKQYLLEQGYGSGSNLTLNTVANLIAEYAAICSTTIINKPQPPKDREVHLGGFSRHKRD